MQIQKQDIEINQNQEKLYEFFSDYNNFEKILPEENEKFEIEGDHFIFQLKNMPEIALEIKEANPYDKIVFGSAKGKIDFTLTLNLKKVNDETSKADLVFNGDFNPMMKMMVERPLTNLMNKLSENMAKL